MLPLLGRRITSATGTLRMASSRSCVLGFMVCPPEMMQCVPRLRKTSASPAPGATATNARSLDRPDRRRRHRRRGRLARCPSSKRGGNGIVAGRHLRDVHVVHVLDDDIGDEAQAHRVAEHDAGIGHVDMHLDQGLIALDQGAVAQRGDLLADGGHIQGCALDQELHVEAVDQRRKLALPFGRLRGDRRRCRRRRPCGFSRGLFAGERAVACPSRMKKSPLPPLSTLPACARTGSSLGVLATASSAARTVRARMNVRSSSRVAALSAAAAASRTTVRMVPSTGRLTPL